MKNMMKILLMVSGGAVFALSGCSSRSDEMQARYGQQQHSMFQQGHMNSGMESEMRNSGRWQEMQGRQGGMRGYGDHMQEGQGGMEVYQDPEENPDKRKQY